jgi:hypothetical protein
MPRDITRYIPSGVADFQDTGSTPGKRDLFWYLIVGVPENGQKGWFSSFVSG